MSRGWSSGTTKKPAWGRGANRKAARLAGPVEVMRHDRRCGMLTGSPCDCRPVAVTSAKQRRRYTAPGDPDTRRWAIPTELLVATSCRNIDGAACAPVHRGHLVKLTQLLHGEGVKVPLYCCGRQLERILEDYRR